jgi:lysophospholipase L1-like esterase
MKALFRFLGMALLVCSLTFVLLEACTYLYSQAFVDYDLEMWKYAKELKTRVADPRGHIHRQNQKLTLMGVEVETDELGNRICELAPKTAKPLLAFIGDSVTFGWGVSSTDTFPCLIGSSFLGKSPQAAVRNFAVGNYNSDAILTQFEKVVVPLSPEIVIWGFYINDIELISLQEDSFLSRHSIFFAWAKGLAHRFKWWNAGEPQYENYYQETYAKNKVAFMKTVQQVQQESTRVGSQLYIVLLPDLNVPERSLVDGIYDDINLSLREIGIRSLNLQSHKEWRSPEFWVSRQDSHPNHVVHQRIFELFCNEYPEVCKE